MFFSLIFHLSWWEIKITYTIHSYSSLKIKTESPENTEMNNHVAVLILQGYTLEGCILMHIYLYMHVEVKKWGGKCWNKKTTFSKNPYKPSKTDPDKKWHLFILLACRAMFKSNRGGGNNDKNNKNLLKTTNVNKFYTL